jgi:hypothetical protein
MEVTATSSPSPGSHISGGIGFAGANGSEFGLTPSDHSVGARSVNGQSASASKSFTFAPTHTPVPGQIARIRVSTECMNFIYEYVAN